MFEPSSKAKQNGMVSILIVIDKQIVFVWTSCNRNRQDFRDPYTPSSSSSPSSFYFFERPKHQAGSPWKQQTTGPEDVPVVEKDGMEWEWKKETQSAMYIDVVQLIW